MNKKLIFKVSFAFVLAMLISLTCVFSNVEATEQEDTLDTEVESEVSGDVTSTNENTNIDGIIDSKVTNSNYKFSDDEKIYLPFFRFTDKDIIVDSEVSGFGACFTNSNIEIKKNISGVQTMFSGDSIRVNDKMEYGILFATNNVTISSEIDGSLIVFAGQKVTITEDAKIKGDIICFTNDLDVNGNVEGSLIGFVTNMTVNGTIGKDLRVYTQNISLGENLVEGNVYINTVNSSLKIPESYTDAKIKVEEAKKLENDFDVSVIFRALIVSVLFTLLYFVINKATKGKYMKEALNKITSHSIMSLLSGSLLLLAIPFVFTLLVILSAVGLYALGVPALIIYFAYILVMSLLSTFIVGATITEYMIKTNRIKILKNADEKTKYVFAFVTFTLLYILARIPYVGSYVGIILVMLGIGFATCAIFTKVSNKEVLSRNNKDDEVKEENKDTSDDKDKKESKEK